MIRLVRVGTDVSDTVLARCLADLDPAEALAWSGDGARQRVQRRRIVARSTLRRLLGRQLGLMPRQVPLRRQAGGKPELSASADAGQSLHFSVSHADGQSLLALAAQPVGVDLEQRIPDDLPQVARHVFSRDEQERLRASAEPAAAFLEIWTAKEAVLKWLGTGFRTEPRAFSLPHASGHFQPVLLPSGVRAAGTGSAHCVVANWRLEAGMHVSVCMAAPGEQRDVAVPPCDPSMTWETYEH